MLHGPAAELSEDKASKRKAALGVKLFFVYMLTYVGFVFIAISNPDLMGEKVLLGLNLAIVYGVGLIILAVLMGFIYHFACNALEDKLNIETEEQL